MKKNIKYSLNVNNIIPSLNTFDFYTNKPIQSKTESSKNNIPISLKKVPNKNSKNNDTFIYVPNNIFTEKSLNELNEHKDNIYGNDNNYYQHHQSNKNGNNFMETTKKRQKEIEILNKLKVKDIEEKIQKMFENLGKNIQKEGK